MLQYVFEAVYISQVYDPTKRFYKLGHDIYLVVPAVKVWWPFEQHRGTLGVTVPDTLEAFCVESCSSQM